MTVCAEDSTGWIHSDICIYPLPVYFSVHNDCFSLHFHLFLSKKIPIIRFSKENREEQEKSHMNISVNSKKDTFHLYNNEISYIMTVLPNRQMGQLYFGKAVHPREDYSWGTCSMLSGIWIMSTSRGLRKDHLMLWISYSSIMSRMASQQLWQGAMTSSAPVS